MIVLPVNRHLDQRGDFVIQRLQPGEPISIGPNTTLTLFVPREMNDAPLALDPYRFDIEARVCSPRLDRILSLGVGNVLDLSRPCALYLWPVALELDNDRLQVLGLRVKFVAAAGGLISGEKENA